MSDHQRLELDLPGTDQRSTMIVGRGLLSQAGDLLRDEAGRATGDRVHLVVDRGPGDVVAIEPFARVCLARNLQRISRRIWRKISKETSKRIWKRTWKRTRKRTRKSMARPFSTTIPVTMPCYAHISLWKHVPYEVRRRLGMQCRLDTMCLIISKYT